MFSNFKILLSGFFLTEVLEYLNVAFLAELPLSVLYLDNVFKAMSSGLYLSLYGILSRFCSPDNLASRLAVFDSLITMTGKAFIIHALMSH